MGTEFLDHFNGVPVIHTPNSLLFNIFVDFIIRNDVAVFVDSDIEREGIVLKFVIEQEFAGGQKIVVVAQFCNLEIIEIASFGHVVSEILHENHAPCHPRPAADSRSRLCCRYEALQDIGRRVLFPNDGCHPVSCRFSGLSRIDNVMEKARILRFVFQFFINLFFLGCMLKSRAVRGFYCFQWLQVGKRSLHDIPGEDDTIEAVTHNGL